MKKGISVILSALILSLFVLTSCSSDISTNSSNSLYDSAYSSDISYNTTYSEESPDTSSAGFLYTQTDNTNDNTTVSNSSSSEYKKTTNSADQSNKSTKKSSKKSEDKKSTIVYITKTGKKYHCSGCRYLKRSKIKISLKEAKAAGYTPCSVCCPPQ